MKSILAYCDEATTSPPYSHKPVKINPSHPNSLVNVPGDIEYFG